MIKGRGGNGEVHSYFTFVVRGSFLGMIWILWSHLTLSMVDGDGGHSSGLKPLSVSIILFYFHYFLLHGLS